MFGVLKTVNLAWVKKIAVIGYTWLFVNQRAFSYEEGMHQRNRRAFFSRHTVQ